MNQSEYSSDNLFLILWAKRRIIIIATAASVIISSAISLLMEDQYASTCIIAPVKANTIYFSGFNMLPSLALNSFGDKEQTEQMMEILGSGELRDIIVEKYNLYDRYKIKKDKKESKYKLISAFRSNIGVSKSKFNAVKIIVLDRNPDTAALIANDMANYYDTIVNKIIAMRIELAHKKVELLKSNLVHEMNVILDSVKSLSKTTKPFETNLTDSKNVISSDIYSIALYNKLSKEIESKTEVHHAIETSRIQYESDMTQQIPQKFVIQEAYATDKKDKPIRWIIVALSAVGTLLFSSILLLFYERFKHLKLA
ncbi:MAG: Wzz/FepE/Etk N-terminal domain-containing protein [Bacteroidia bacterium]